jgi:acyl dehydratase
MTQPAPTSAISDEIRQLLGKQFGPLVYEVDKSMIQRFAEAIEDPNPLYNDDAYAKKSRYGALLAPPTFVTALRLDEFANGVIYAKCPLPGVLNGGNEIEYFQPIKAGDMISVTGKLANVREPQLGKMLLLIMEFYFHNQKKEPVAKCTLTIIRR